MKVYCLLQYIFIKKRIQTNEIHADKNGLNLAFFKTNSTWIEGCYLLYSQCAHNNYDENITTVN